MFVYTLAKFDDARRGAACGCQIVDLRAHLNSIHVTYIVASGIDFTSPRDFYALIARKHFTGYGLGQPYLIGDGLYEDFR